MNLRPINKLVLAHPIKETKKSGSIILKEEVFNHVYLVIAVSPDVEGIQVGQRIQCDKFGGRQVDIDGEQLSLIPESAILGIYE